MLFIGGMGRSGSTLVERLLNEWPQTLAVGETVHLWERGVRNQERCGCGAGFDQCPQWSAVGHKAFGGWDQVDLDDVIELRWQVDRTRQLRAISRAIDTGRLRPNQRRYLAYQRSVLLAAAEVAGSGPAPVLLESSKHVSTAALLSIDPELDVRVLHLIRDPRGVAYSWTKTVPRPETDGEVMPTYSPARSAARWVSDNLAFEALGQRVPTLRMHYEDFLADPARWLIRIGGFMDLVPDEIDLRYLRGRQATLTTPMHSVAGNPLRFGGDQMKLRVDDGWRRHLPRRHAAVVTAITGPLLNRYGYPLQG